MLKKINFKISSSPEILKNFSWLIFDKFFKILVGFFVSIWVARYLGPNDLGVLSIAIAIAAIIQPLVTIGLNSLLPKELISNPDKHDEIIGTSLFLMFLSGSICFAVFLPIISYFNFVDSEQKIITIIVCSSILFRFRDVFKYWFEASLKNKYVVMAESLLYGITSSIKIFFIVTSKPLIYFSILFTVDAFFASMALFLIYVKYSNAKKIFSFNKEIAKSLAYKAMPLTFASLTIILYMRIDQLMLGYMVGNESTGLYTAATKLTEILYFIPITIISVLLPTLLKSKNISIIEYNRKFSLLYVLMIFLSLVISIPSSLLSNFIIDFLYGDGFQQSSKIFMIHTWTLFFVFLNVANNQWLINEELQKYILYKSIFGLIINIILNTILIYYFSAIGAAIATLLSQASTLFLITLFKKTRPGAVLILHSPWSYYLTIKRE